MKRYPLFALLSAALAAAGCGERKSHLYGVVTLDGKPLDGGTLQLSPVAGDGQTAGAVIGKDGKYRTVASPTKLKVAISASRKVGERKMYDTPDSPMQDLFEEVVPAKYSDMGKTELTVTPAAAADTEYNIDLKSEPKKK